MSNHFELSDEEWREINQDSSLPTDARTLIENAINRYRIMANTVYRPSPTRSSLLEANKAAVQLCNRLKLLLKDNLAHLVLAQKLKSSQTVGHATPQLAAREHLSHIIAEVDDLAQSLEQARNRVAKARPGARTKAFPIHLLVRDLDQILHRFTHRKIARSTKSSDTSPQYVATVCKIADKRIGKGSIDAAMKHRIKLRGKISSES